MTISIQPQPRTDRRREADRTAAAVEPSAMIGALYALIVANLVQVLAGFAAADPSPPAEVVPAIAATALLGLGAMAIWVRSLLSGEGTEG